MKKVENDDKRMNLMRVIRIFNASSRKFAAPLINASRRVSIESSKALTIVSLYSKFWQTLFGFNSTSSRNASKAEFSQKYQSASASRYGEIEVVVNKNKPKFLGRRLASDILGEKHPPLSQVRYRGYLSIPTFARLMRRRI